MRSWLVASTLALIAGGCQAASIGSYPDSLDQGEPLPPRSGSTAADADAGATRDAPRPKGKPAITVTLSGPGTVTSTPAGLTCSGTTCTGAFDPGTTVKLVPTPASGAFFVGWSGQCTGAGACSPVANGDMTISAEFQSLVGTWSGPYTHSETVSGCTFNNAGDLSVVATAPKTAAALPTSATVTGLEIRDLSQCVVIGKQNGTAASDLTVTDGTLTGTWKFAIPGVGGTLDLPFTATLQNKTTMTGTWTCNGCTGSFTLTKK